MASAGDSSSGVMYKLPSYYEGAPPVELPNNMYKLASIYGDSCQNASSDGGQSDHSAEVNALEKRQESILERLRDLQNQVNDLSKNCTASSSSVSATTAAQPASQPPVGQAGSLQDIVVSASPSSVPLSLLVLYRQLQQLYKTLGNIHVHSSANQVPDNLKSIFGENNVSVNRSTSQLAFTLIWKAVEHGPCLMVSPGNQVQIQGEANVARYISRMMSNSYENHDIKVSTQIDGWLDSASLLLRGNQKEKGSVLKNLNAKLGQSQWLVGADLSLADIVMWSAVHQTQNIESVQGNIKKWIKLCNQQDAFSLALNVL